MEAAMNVLVCQFKTFAGTSRTLSNVEFRDLVAMQLPNFVKTSGGPEELDQLMASVDANSDGELTFLEFWQLIGALANKQGGFGQ
ncbi:protein S100-A11 [Neosynchiropus ocellatus]